MNSLQELIAQKEALERQIAEVQRSTRADAIAKVRAIMAEYGLTVDDLGGRGQQVREPRGERTSKKVAAKYRDAVSGQEWTGRGLKPKWLQSALASGKSLDDFLIG